MFFLKGTALIMKTLLVYAVVISLIIPQTFAHAAGFDDSNAFAPKQKNYSYSIENIVNQASVEDDISSSNARIHELKQLANIKLPQAHALDSTLDRNLSKNSSLHQYTNEDGKSTSVKIDNISINGVLSAKEKLKFLKILEAEDKTVEDMRSGKLEVIFYFPEDIERARVAKTIREEAHKDVILVEVTHQMAQYFNQVAADAQKTFFQRSYSGFMEATKNSTVFLRDIAHSVAAAKLKGEFKKYVDTVSVRPTPHDDHIAWMFTGINTGFTSAVFVGLNMDHVAFTGFLSLSVFTTLVLTRYWRTINNIFKTDIRNPYKYAPEWRRVFSRVVVIGTSTTAAQFSMGAHLGALQYLPSQEVALGNIASIGVGDAYFSTKRNRVLSADASATIALYTYVLMALPSRTIAQYAKEINFSNILEHGGHTVDLLWHPIRDWRFDGGFIEFTGVSIFIMGSYFILSQILKKKARAAEELAQLGFLKYLRNKFDRKKTSDKTYNIEEMRLRTREDYLARQLDLAKAKAMNSAACKAFFK